MDGESQRGGLLREVKVGGLASRSFQGRHYIGRGNFGKRGAPLDSAWFFLGGRAASARLRLQARSRWRWPAELVR